MLVFALFLVTAFNDVLAQAPAGAPPAAPAASSAQPLEDGPCLDSTRSVPRVIASPVSRGMQIVRIDEVLSTATMMPGTVIGFLYTTQDGSTWLGERTAAYMSPASATAINQVLSSTHAPTQNVKSFPPQSHYGVPTKLPQLFKVSIPQDALGPLRIQMAPCVAWPAGRPLPDPMM
ncbi:MAG TPA: hypothetical protein VGG70_02395 [Candidatus Cybelea sp.]